MSVRTKFLYEIFSKSSQFKHVVQINDTIFIVNNICNLTGFCCPSYRRGNREVRLDFELGITFVARLSDPYKELINNFEDGRFLTLPKSITPAHSLDMMLSGSTPSEWLLDTMTSLMQKYCCNGEDTLKAVTNPDDRFIMSLKNIFSAKFERVISEPLRSSL